MCYRFICVETGNFNVIIDVFYWDEEIGLYACYLMS